ncbi:MAG: glycoside hydrolase family 9 protein [Ruminococcus sp.]|nr:glycoside hydrolase family 9 protein [Ruminococcus sp.]
MFSSKKRITAFLLSSVMACAALPSVTLSASAAATPNKIDYNEIDRNWAKLLQYSMFFYDANMCGTGISENNLLPWRGDCHIYDAAVPLNSTATNLPDSFIKQYQDILDPDGDGTVDVSGGFHDAGDHVKFGLPEAYAGSTVSWGYYEFREAYEKTGQDKHAETICRYFCDYFMRSTFRDKNGDVIAFCYQVGDGAIDHEYWQSPEIDAMSRPAWFATSSLPTTDDVSESAACLAINYYNFLDSDPEYAEKCLDYAKALFAFAEKNDKEVGKGADGPASFYTSSKWEDDYAFAACWLYLITNDHDYLDACLQYVDYYAPPGYVYCWNDMWNGVSILLGRIQDIYPNVTEEYREAGGRNPYEDIDFWYMEAKALHTYIDGKKGIITPNGYFYLDTWGSARYNTAAQFCALVYDKYNKGKDKYSDSPYKDYAFSDWALGQMEYLIGDNSLGRCYVVGYGENAAKFPHHRAASGLTKCEDTADHKHVLYGALVGGPDDTDEHNDITKDYIYNEVTIDYNAAFVGACAGLYLYNGDDTMLPEENFPPEEKVNDAELFSGDSFWVSGYCQEKPETTGAGVTKLTFFVNTDCLTAHTDISVRYYFSIEEFENKTIPGSFVFQQTYDQVQTEVSGCAAKLVTPTQWKDDIYYIEVAWPDYAIANSNKKIQLILGNYYGEAWDSTNDWSKKGMIDIGDKYDDIVSGVEYAEKCDNICVYASGKLVGGIEPDGTVPEKTYNMAQLVRLIRAVTSEKPFEDAQTADLFDFYPDKIIDIKDVTMLKRILLKQN